MVTQYHRGQDELVPVSENGGLVQSAKGLKLHVDTDFKTCPQLDYLLVPGGQGTRTEVNNDSVIQFLKTQSALCKNILSVCTGSFLLHKADLLKGKQATTHWASLDRLRALNDITVAPERYLHEDNIWMSAGISAGMDMALAFLADTAGEQTAGDVQLQAEYYPDGTIYPNKAGYIPEYL